MMANLLQNMSQFQRSKEFRRKCNHLSNLVLLDMQAAIHSALAMVSLMLL